MNKLELVEALREEAGITKNEAEVIVNMVFEEMSNTMANGDRVEIRGLCSFCVKQYKA
ncbi:MAG: HU family DNA-binding protein, partial [Deltaproteobacteria bacterium]|nr:HU family DNA-binding protein [Deltaproteobacteria bacterium]